jgi:hypothetical protein
MTRSKLHTIQLNDTDFNNLMNTANQLKGPIDIILSGPDAVRLLVSFQQGFTVEQAIKYKQAIDAWQKEEE